MKYPRGIYERDGIIYIRFQDERGKIVRESTHQSSIKVGQEILGKRKTEVAGGTFFPARRFEKVRIFGACRQVVEGAWPVHAKLFSLSAKAN